MRVTRLSDGTSASLDLTRIEKRFGGVHALKGVDFSLRAGEIHALLGENGAGKSTLIKVLSGVIQQDSGEIRIDGQVISIDSVATAQKNCIQTVYQELELALPLTVAENIFMGRLPGGRMFPSDRALRVQARAALDSIGAEIDPAATVDTLSISDRQIVEIVRALVRNGKFLILDEPTAALPPREVARLMDIIRQLRDSGVGILYVSHRLDEVIEIADRVTVLRDGHKVVELDRQQVTRDLLVRHILGRELAEFKVEHATATGPAQVTCVALRSQSQLSGLTFELHKGEILGFFGLLGAGQSAIGDALFGLRPAESSTFQTPSGQGLPANPRAAMGLGMGYVPADRKGAGVALQLSIAHNLLLANMGSVSRFGFLKQKELYRKAQELVKRYDIRCSSVHQAVSELSGGNQQKVAVSKWAARKVRTLFLDEPTRGVDVGAKVEIYKFMKSFADEGGSCMFSSSDATEICAIADRVIILKSGAAVAELRGREIAEHALIAAAL